MHQYSTTNFSTQPVPNAGHQLETQGFTLLDLRLSISAVMGLREHLDVAMSLFEPRQIRSSDDEEGRFNLQLIDLRSRIDVFAGFAEEFRLDYIASKLLCERAVFMYDQALIKPPRVGATVSWHQDNAFWRCAPARALTIWVSLGRDA